MLEPNTPIWALKGIETSSYLLILADTGSKHKYRHLGPLLLDHGKLCVHPVLVNLEGTCGGAAASGTCTRDHPPRNSHVSFGAKYSRQNEGTSRRSTLSKADPSLPQTAAKGSHLNRKEMARDNGDAAADNPPSTPDSPTSAGFNTDQLPFNTSRTSENFSTDDEAAVEPDIIRDEPEEADEEEEGEDLFNENFLELVLDTFSSDLAFSLIQLGLRRVPFFFFSV